MTRCKPNQILKGPMIDFQVAASHGIEGRPSGLNACCMATPDVGVSFSCYYQGRILIFSVRGVGGLARGLEIFRR